MIGIGPAFGGLRVFFLPLELMPVERTVYVFHAIQFGTRIGSPKILRAEYIGIQQRFFPLGHEMVFPQGPDIRNALCLVNKKQLIAFTQSQKFLSIPAGKNLAKRNSAISVNELSEMARFRIPIKLPIVCVLNTEKLPIVCDKPTACLYT